MRQFWTRRERTIGDIGYRAHRLERPLRATGAAPHASINFVTAHDGFTLRDLVTYEKKRNVANGEDNRDGWDDNMSWNSGAEGPTDDERKQHT